MSDKHFIEGCENLRKKGEGSDEILNWYRNLYYKENLDTERGIVAMALNDILPELASLREKQIPKKPYSDNDNGIYEKDCCPTCHRSLFPNDHHCKCGQALDWSDEE